MLITKPMMATTIAIVGIRSARSPSSARSAASIAYATDDTGSPITVNANAINSTCRDCEQACHTGAEPVSSVGLARGVRVYWRVHNGSADQSSRRTSRTRRCYHRP